MHKGSLKNIVLMCVEELASDEASTSAEETHHSSRREACEEHMYLVEMLKNLLIHLLCVKHCIFQWEMYFFAAVQVAALGVVEET